MNPWVIYFLIMYTAFGGVVALRYTKDVVRAVSKDKFGTTALPRGAGFFVYALSGLVVLILWPIYLVERKIAEKKGNDDEG